MKCEAAKTGNLHEKRLVLETKISEIKLKLTESETKISKLELKLLEYESKFFEQARLIKWYEERLRLNAVKKYGPSSEQSGITQLGFFDEAETTADKKAAEPDIEQITYKRKKRVGKREEDFSALPVETVVHELPAEEQACPDCGNKLHVMGKDIRKELTIIPAQVKVTEHIRNVYSCRNCEKTAVSVPVIKAPMPEPVIKGSAAAPSAIAHIMTQKYVMHSPLYRLEQDFERQGIALSRQTMANWMIKTSNDWLEPVYKLLQKELIKNEALHADETPLQVLREPGRAATSESRMWLYRTSAYTTNPVAFYDYQETRSSSHPKRFLEGWRGYLHTDGYSGYHSLSGVTPVGCWAHMRRKFDEALKSMSAAERESSKAQTGLEFCNNLFAFEREFAELDPSDRFKRRLELSKPEADKFFAWTGSFNTLPKSPLGKAIKYAFDQKEYLMNVYLDGRLELSNNRAERSIKPFVMGRKNWLFSCTPKGARASSVIYSVIETAKENGLNPFEYLKFLFETIPNSTASQIETLLPWSNSLPQKCRTAASV